MSIAQRLVNLSDGLSVEGILSAAKGGTGTTTGAGSSSTPTISAIAYGGDDTATNPAGGATITLTGTNFASGAKVLINTTPVSVVTVVSSTQITFTAPALSAGSYILYVVNLDGSTAIAVPGIQYSGTPAWTTAAGSLGTGYETAAVSTTVSATSDSAVSYSVVSGTLPAGVTINSSGTVSGTSPAVGGSTTYTFTVRATDAENQDTDRQFSLTINPDVVVWSSSNAIALSQNVASTTTLAATSAAGKTVSYSVDTLPAGLTLSGATVSGTATSAGTTTTTATATAAVTGKTAQQTITWTVSIAADTYFPYTTLLLNAETDLVPFATDASANNFPVTVAGDTKPTKFNPYTPGYYSNYWDGTGDSLVVTGNGSVVNFGTADFTIETWFYANTLSPQFLILDTCPGGVVSPTNRIYLDVTSDGTIRYVTYQGTNVLISSSAGAVVGKQWTHVALVKSSSQTKLYLNGTQVGSTYADTLNYPSQTNRPILCANGYDGGSYGTTGYLSNLRIVKGVAVYNANFTPPTAPLTAISGTSLLTCQSNRLVDVSTNAFTMTRTGDVAVSGFQPFTPSATYATYGSTHFDGTGDYLSVPDNPAFTMGAGDFTVECWVYLTGVAQQVFIGTCNAAGSQSSMSFVLGLNGSSYPYVGVGYAGTVYTSAFGTSLVTNQWYHLAGVRNGAMVNIYVNGVKGPDLNMAALAITDSTETVAIGRNGAGDFEYVTGYISNARIVKGTAVYTGAFTPPTSPLTAITNTQLLTCRTHQPSSNSQFVDNSTLSGPITRTGNTTQGTFSPYGANWSNYFDGTGDYLSMPSAPTTYLAANAFTMEAWVYPTAENGVIIGRRAVVTARGFWLAYANVTSKKFSFYAGDTNNASWELTLTSTNSFELNKWHHVAITRNASNLFTLWVNGSAEATATSSFTIGDDSSTLYVGTVDGGSTPFTGYMSNLRIVQNTALYTAAFTPPTEPLTPVNGTGLLTCQSSNLVDNSLNASTITKAGDTRVEKFSPFATVTQTPTTHSVYFDGSGDYLTLPSSSVFSMGTGDFTAEAWVYTTTSNTQRIISSTGNNFELLLINTGSNVYLNWYDGVGDTTSGTNYVPQNSWAHVAVSRSGNSLKLFINGTVSGTSTNSVSLPASPTLYIGRYGGGDLNAFTGYISNLRVVKNTALYTANFTPATQPLTAVSGTSLLTCQDATIRDNSANNFTLTAAGNTVPLAFNPFGYTTSAIQEYSAATFGGSAYFDNSGDYLALPTSPTYLIGTGNFTIECWVYKRSTTFDAILSYGSGSGMRIFVNATGGLELWVGASQQWIFPAIIPNNQWNHIAFVRTGSTLTGYVNGVAAATATVSTDYNAGTLNIGGEGTGSPWGGYITDLRITRGQALYTSNFVPPQAPLTAVTNTTLLLNMDKSAIADKSGKVVLESVGDAKISTAVKKYGSSSMYFDGTGDYLSIPNNPVFNFGTGDFTVEAWIYLPTVTNVGIIGFGSGGFFVQINTSTNIHISQANVVDLGDFTISPAISANTWYHLAMTRSGTSMRAFINGIQQGSTLTNSTNFTATNATIVGGHPGPIILYSGYMDDLRVTRGYARYTANFTPPAQALLTK